MSQTFIDAIKAMDSKVKAAVRFNSKASPFFCSNIGVKQGDPSSTLLFLYFVNDIFHQFDSNIDGLFTVNDLKLFLFMFANDAVLFAHTPMTLQSLLNDLNTYCNILKQTPNATL